MAGDEEIPERECVACKNLKSGVVGVVWCLVGVYCVQLFPVSRKSDFEIKAEALPK